MQPAVEVVGQAGARPPRGGGGRLAAHINASFVLRPQKRNRNAGSKVSSTPWMLSRTAATCDPPARRGLSVDQSAAAIFWISVKAFSRAAVSLVAFSSASSLSAHLPGVRVVVGEGGRTPPEVLGVIVGLWIVGEEISGLRGFGGLSALPPSTGSRLWI